MSPSEIFPFKVDIPSSEVDRLKRKLLDTRLPPKPIVPDAGSRYGPTFEWAKNLYDALINDFDWYPIQDQINSAPHFLTRLEDVKIHFVHAKSPRPDAIPLLMVHGWPGSFFEFNQVWGPLSNPSDPSLPAFHVVLPSMPGYCFSDWPPRSGWTLQDNARIFDALMKRLGYKEYMIQTGFYWDTEPSSKRAVERTGNLVWYKKRNDGGHYAALEDPEGITEDVQELAAKYWKSDALK